MLEPRNIMRKIPWLQGKFLVLSRNGSCGGWGGQHLHSVALSSALCRPAIPNSVTLRNYGSLITKGTFPEAKKLSA